MPLLKRLSKGSNLLVRLLIVVSLITIGTSLTSCSLGHSYDDLSWLEPIEFTQETKDWMMSHSPWPDHVREDFNKIAVFNDTLRSIRNH